METGARAWGLAGCARESAHGDGVSGRSIAAAKVRSSYTRTTARSGRAPQPRDLPLRIPAKMIRGGARCAILIASRQNIKNRANPLTTNEKTFSNRWFFGHFGANAAPHQSQLTNRVISIRYK